MATKRDFVIAYGLQADKSTGSSDTLYVDYINDRVGIGTLLPTQKLHVQGNLHVTGNLTVDGTSPGGGGGGGSSISLGNTSISIADTGSDGTITFTTEGTTAMTLSNSQRLGLGTSVPQFKGDVDGDFRIRSANKLRFGGTTTTTNFYVQYNSTTNSLDFVAG